MKLPKLVLAIAGLALVAAPSVSFAQGNIFITGHDVDDHGNSAYFAAGLDYLAYGAAASGAQIAGRSALKVGYLANSNGGTGSIAAGGYSNVTFIDLDTAGWQTTALNTGAGKFDILVIGTGADYVFAAGSTALNSFAVGATSFATYFNAGGSLFVNSEQGLGQTFYNFVPSFGVASTSSISDVGAFTPTAAGLAIGLTNTIVDMDITHTTFSGVSGAFTIFETYDPTGAAVAIGLRNAVIDTGGGGFVPGGAVPEPSTYGMIGAAVLVGAAMLRRRKSARA
ncbi:MAG TPA: PEP-CTERM sorting domain-containing protein [Opitutaceae bacterium]|nr:PEP-CTERM sorting domain-containing protein [Opitutaceae bacterium]